MTPKQLGPYRIVEQIGRGGMGAVYKAVYDKSGPNQGAVVAIKALNPQLAMAEGFRERFEAEIESLKKLKHAGIVRLFGYGEQDGLLFYSMELVEGPSLEEELNDGRRFTWHETLQIGIQICKALKHAHDHGVVHRDIKPANIMLTPDNQVKIADFGIARLFGGTQLTIAGGVLGTADYMSPEQADGLPVTEKCDQYSLGGVLYALLAGRPPFRAKTLPEMLQLQRFAEPEPVRRYASDTPDALDRLITQLLSKDPNDRFPNVLVLSRHMEAMDRALSRPKKTTKKDDTTKGNAAKSEAKSPAIAPVPSTDKTLGHDQLATRAGDAPIMLPHETTAGPIEPGLYDAPTLEQPSETHSASAAAKSLLPQDTVDKISANKAAATKASDEALPEQAVAPYTSDAIIQPPTLATTAASANKTHFTTVDEDARRQRELSRANPWVLITQLAGLLATLGLMGWGGWQLMKPPTADQLFASIQEVAEKQGINNWPRATVEDTAEDVEAFFEQFPDDPRTAELIPLQEQLEFQKYEHKARRRSRFVGDAGLEPIEQVYFNAISVAEDDPAGALAMMQALVDLYDPAHKITSFEAAKAISKHFDKLGDPRLLVLAHQRIEQLDEQIKTLAARELPALKQRLAQAHKLSQHSPAPAKRMYEAVIKLYSDQPWASKQVEAARTAIETINKLNSNDER